MHGTEERPTAAPLEPRRRTQLSYCNVLLLFSDLVVLPMRVSLLQEASVLTRPLFAFLGCKDSDYTMIAAIKAGDPHPFVSGNPEFLDPRFLHVSVLFWSCVFMNDHTSSFADDLQIYLVLLLQVYSNPYRDYFQYCHLLSFSAAGWT
ncbi:hypothetical protein CHELA20_40012 [Hyphomicrobiales bacterium]|nr:hypothetical protein CHELA20_40012 [Hyphomicrobiales bacterium]CAH1687425.1 hypothetical protein CHELA41_40012 [Hyphomicrobiales bacterium]